MEEKCQKWFSTYNKLKHISNLVWLNQQPKSKLRITGPLWGQPQVTSRFPSQNISNAWKTSSWLTYRSQLVSLGTNIQIMFFFFFANHRCIVVGTWSYLESRYWTLDIRMSNVQYRISSYLHVPYSDSSGKCLLFIKATVLYAIKCNLYIAMFCLFFLTQIYAVFASSVKPWPMLSDEAANIILYRWQARWFHVNNGQWI